jgi:hypothetical protein
VRFRSSGLPGLRWHEQLGLRLGGERELLAAMFPCVAYGVGGERDWELTRYALTAWGDASELRRAYLRYWGAASDPNFMFVARRLGLVLEARGR